MIRIALDTDVLGDLPAGVAPVLMTYADLITSQPQLLELRDYHRGSELVFIDRGLGDPLGLGSVADVELGALSPFQLPGWFEQHTQQGVRYLTAYSSRDTLPAIDSALAGTPWRNHWRWVARLDGIWQVPGFQPLHRPALVQVVGENMLGIHADASIVLSARWHPQGALAAELTEDIPQGSDSPGPTPGASANAFAPPAPDALAGDAPALVGWDDDPFPPESRPRPA